MERLIGTVSRGIRGPIVHEGDNLSDIVVESVTKALESENIQIREKDIIAVTESILGRAQGNYATIDNIATDIKNKTGGETLGVIFPILSRNRFSIILRGIAKGVKKVVLMLSYPSDEVGNHLVSMDLIDEKGVNPYSDVLTEKEWREKFGVILHPFTGVDYIQFYKDIITDAGAEVEIIFGNKATDILSYTKNVLTCDIHTRARSKRLLKANGAKVVLGLDDIMTESINGSGYNANYGLLGANKATEDKIKLFPIKCNEFVLEVQQKMFEKTGKKVEVMIYGDGAFKDPMGKIWELADPVVSPGYTDGLKGKPNEIKLKYLADNDFADLKGEELEKAVNDYIKNKGNDLTGDMSSQGTTPRQLTDLIGSLCDLTSGSGDKGTPFIYIQGYFDNYTD